MNSNIIQSYYLLTKIKIKQLNFDNYYFKLLCILNFNSVYQKIKSKNKSFYNLNQIKKVAGLKKIDTIYSTTDIIFCCPKKNCELSELENLVNLTYLRIENTNLSFIPINISNLTNLTYLSINNNLLTFIQSEFSNLINLKIFGLANNLLKIIPTNFANLNKLEHFYIQNNLITIIPTDFGKLVNLKLFLISKLPTELLNLSNLRMVSIDSKQKKLFGEELK
jgi:hypothetical protein